MGTPYKCPKCGLANAMGSVHCQACGTHLGMPPPRPSAPRFGNVQQSGPPKQQTPTASRSPNPVVQQPPSAATVSPGTVLNPFAYLGTVAGLKKLWADIRQSCSLLIVTLCTAFFAFISALNLLEILSWQRAVYVLGLSYAGIAHRLWIFQLVTAPFLHSGLLHLVFNMLTLYMLGSDLETRLGQRHYLKLSAVCAAASTLTFLILSRDTDAVALGYSGVIFGILAAQAMLFPNRQILFYGIFPMAMKNAALLLGAIVLFLSMTERGGFVNISYLAGGLAAWFYLPRILAVPVGPLPSSHAIRWIATLKQRFNRLRASGNRP